MFLCQHSFSAKQNINNVLNQIINMPPILVTRLVHVNSIYKYAYLEICRAMTCFFQKWVCTVWCSVQACCRCWWGFQLQWWPWWRLLGVSFSKINSWCEGCKTQLWISLNSFHNLPWVFRVCAIGEFCFLVSGQW